MGSIDSNEKTHLQPTSADARNVDDSVAAPTAIGRYKIIRLLGKGGFGQVFLADDTQLNRNVAVKVPHGGLSEKQATMHLEEARTVAALDHPNIVPVFDVGTTNDHPLFIVSKFVEGRTLRQRMRSQPLTTREAVNVIASMADALHYAHLQGCVHRDVKPANILLDDADEPFLVDFGLALRHGSIAEGLVCAGTPAYMSPNRLGEKGIALTVAQMYLVWESSRTKFFQVRNRLKEPRILKSLTRFFITIHAPFGSIATKSLENWIG